MLLNVRAHIYILFMLYNSETIFIFGLSNCWKTSWMQFVLTGMTIQIVVDPLFQCCWEILLILMGRWGNYKLQTFRRILFFNWYADITTVFSMQYLEKLLKVTIHWQSLSNYLPVEREYLSWYTRKSYLSCLLLLSPLHLMFSHCLNEFTFLGSS